MNHVPQHRRQPARPGAVYALVRFDGRTDGQVAEVVVAFENPSAADQYASGTGVDHYAVAPLAFDVPASPLPPRTDLGW